MSVDFLYSNAFGRFLMKVIQRTGMFRLGSLYLRSRLSKRMILPFVEKNHVEMNFFELQRYETFAEFFARSRDVKIPAVSPDSLISPCDGLLSIYDITQDLVIPMKGSHYRLSDLVQRESVENLFCDGLCLVFRLRASDYHHFCCLDDALVAETYHIPGMLHSVQPIACEKYPVFRLNRRWCSILETSHFGTAVQIEVGAMMVGGVRLAEEGEYLEKGEDMGNFELAGSTVILLLDASVKGRLRLENPFYMSEGKAQEIPVSMGMKIGGLER